MVVVNQDLRSAGTLLAVLCSLVLLVGCSSDSVSGALTPDETWLPLPIKRGIIPLREGHRWEYSNTLYDSTEIHLPHYTDESFGAEVGRAFGVTDSGTLVAFTSDTPDSQQAQTFRDTVFAYDWHVLGHGPLVTYSEPLRHPEVPRAGLFVMGWFTADSAWLYDTPKLRLAYPADEGEAWVYTDQGGGDLVVTYVSGDEVFFLPGGRMEHRAGNFYRCHMFREERGDSALYRYYLDEYGELGGLLYVGGVRRRSYFLTSFSAWGY